jgi:hypothetical protein
MISLQTNKRYPSIVNFEIQVLQRHEGKHIHKYGIREEHRITFLAFGNALVEVGTRTTYL